VGTAVMDIRPMTTGDLESVVTLEHAHQPRPWSSSVFTEELDAENRVYLVAEREGRVVGFGGVMLVGVEAHVTNLLVEEEVRGGGIGRGLMISLIEAAISAGARHLTLEVRVANEAARSLYAGLGLAPVGVRPRYYGDDDALILWAHDIDRPEYLEGLR
jgi:ribosomal-protein-alanine N-acetyltransferase